MKKRRNLLELYKIQRLIIDLKIYQAISKSESVNQDIFDKPKVKVLTRNKVIS